MVVGHSIQPNTTPWLKVSLFQKRKKFKQFLEFETQAYFMKFRLAQVYTQKLNW